MPRDSQGVFTLVPSYLAVTGEDIVVENHNPPLEDIANALTGSLPRNGVAPMMGNLPMGGFRITGLGTATNATDAATLAQAQGVVPVGTVLDFAGSTPPTGYLLCHGQPVSRTTYAALFTAIGTAFGAGNGTTTFNLPDCRGRVSAGMDNMGGGDASRLTPMGAARNTVGGAGGASTHTLTPSEMPSHQHSGATNGAGAHSHSFTIGANPGGATTHPQMISSSASVRGDLVHGVGNHAHSFTTNAAGGGAAHNNVQPTIIFNKIIKTF